MLGSNFVFKLVNLNLYKVERTSSFASKIPYLAIFRLELEKAIVMLDFTSFNLSKCNISCKKKLHLIQDQICLIQVVFGWDLKKLLYCDIFYQQHQIFPNTKFRPKVKILKFGTKMLHLKSASSNLLTCNVSSKNKNTLNLESKVTYLGIFGLQFNKNYCQIFNQYSRTC